MCKLLSVPARVRIVQLLRGRALSVGALSSRLGITQGAVSQHLRVLRDAGVVAAEKRGYYVHYRLDEKLLARWKARIGRFLRPEPRKDARPARSGRRPRETMPCAARKKAVRSPKT